MKHIHISFLLLLALVLGACGPTTTPPETVAIPGYGEEALEGPVQDPVTLRIAVLPIIDALPMFIAQEEGLFAKHGANVEFVPVASAPERDQLVAAKQAEGMINETISDMLFNKESIQVQAVRYALRPSAGYGHFFILASGQSGITTPEGLSGVEIGVSQGTVIEYVTERLLTAEGLDGSEIKTIPVPKLPDRMALLASGELQAGTLPDPLGALAVQSGAVIVLDDSEYPEYGFSVYSFRKEIIDSHPEAVRAFLAAIEEATMLVNADPGRFTTILSEAKIVPPALLEAYQVPPFPTAAVPTLAEWNDALEWAKSKGMLENDISYTDSVNPALLP